jgi:hypothetical protein
MLTVSYGALAYARWTRPVVTVRDRSSAVWNGIIERAVADWNAVLPRRAPRFVDTRDDPAPCEALVPVDGEIIMCSDAAELRYQGRTESKHRVKRGRYIIPWAIVHLDDVDAARFPERQQALACHELGHAMTAIPDHPERPHPDTSCVQGWLDRPGSWDIAYARDNYAKHRKPNRRHR